MKRKKQDLKMPLEKQTTAFLEENRELAEAIEVFRFSELQYKTALQALWRPEIRVSNSTNEE